MSKTVEENSKRVSAIRGTLDTLKAECGGTDLTLGAMLVAYYLDKLTSELMQIRGEIGKTKLPSIK